jgi:acyl-CoA thioesterase I
MSTLKTSFSAFSFLILFVFLSCKIKVQGDYKVEDMKKSILFLALGDSYTIGESVDKLDRWPMQLRKHLQEKGVEVQEPLIIATTGWTTGELKRGISENVPKGGFDLVSLLIGVNNQYRGYSQEEYRVEFEELLKIAISFAGDEKSKVFVLSIPDWGVTPFAKDRDALKIASEIDSFNSINKEVSQDYGISYFDITPISRHATSDPELIAGDGLHPSGKMYNQWVNLIFEDIYKKVKKGN